MISWIRTRRSDHPLADPRDAKELLGDLSGRDPVHALQALSEYLDSIKTAGTLNLRRALEIVDGLDRVGRPHHRHAAKELCCPRPRLTNFQANRLWTSVGEYLVQLAEAYQACLAVYAAGATGASALRNQYVQMLARAVRMRGATLTWDYVRYKSQFGNWSELYRLYGLAEMAGRESEKVLLYRGGRLSSVEREFKQALMLSVASPDSLMVGQIDVAHHIAAYLGDYLSLSAASQTARPYFFDPQSGAPPGRELIGLRPPSGARRFGAGEAERELRTLCRLAEEGRFPVRDLGLEHQPEDLIKATLHHLIARWCEAPPERRHARHRKLSRISVVHGFEEVVSNVGNLLIDYPFVSEEEPWLIENESKGGLGAIVAAPKGAWLSVGALIAFRAEDPVWNAAIVRRIQEENDNARAVGVEILSRGGLGVSLYRNRRGQEEGTLCVWLAAERSADNEVSLLMPPAAYSPTSTRVMRVHDNQYLLTPVALTAAGTNYEVGRYRVMARAEVA